MPVGFLLHPTYRIEKGLPIVHLFGKLETGESFVLRDTRARPHFFIEEADLERASALLGRSVSIETVPLRTMQGRPVARVSYSSPPDTPGLRERLRRSGVACYEADIPFATRYLIDHGIRGAMEIEGEGRPGRRIGRIFEDASIAPASTVPALRVLSIDIETDPRARWLLSIGLYAGGIEESLLVLPKPERGAGPPLPARARAFEDERTLLRSFLDRLAEIDPDVLVGWNLIDFDLSFLEGRCREFGVPFLLGRAEIPSTVRVDRSFWGSSRASIAGRVALDGVSLLRGASVRLPDYRLETAARTFLGEGKVQAGPQRAEWIEQAWRSDLETFVDYNIRDARLAYDVIAKLGLLPLAIRRSLLTGMPLDRVGASIASFDFLYLQELRKRGMVAPSVDEEAESEPTVGGYVLESRPGLYKNILVFDYRSLYPSLILTFHLDPLSLCAEGGCDGEEDPIVAPNGARFRREGGILPSLLERFFPERLAAKERGDAVGSTAYKILMNSFYGVLGTARCRFHSPATANAITRFGQTILLWTKAFVESRGYRVLYGDTDSLFVESGTESAAEALAIGKRIAAEVNEALTVRLREEWNVENRLLLQFERLYERFFLPGLRHSLEGSKKRYAGIVRRGGEEEIVFTGLESARRDWTDLAKAFQKELLARVFREEPVDRFIRAFAEEVRGGRRDSDLIYRKALRKPAESYTKTTPPHVKAARQMEDRDGRIVSYVMTIAGPEPAAAPQHPIDYEHYVEKQLRPIAESVLACLGSSWERVWSGQSDLFA